MKFTPPKWLGCIPQGTHGSGIIQKKYWKVISDYVRITDWYKYKVCISCGKHIEHWSMGQAGHYRAWSVCRGYSKWDPINIFMQCAYCNNSNDNLVSTNFAKNIVIRYGQDRLDTLENFTNRQTDKLEDHVIVGFIEKVIKDMGDLPEQPEYYQKAIAGIELSTSVL
jgi:hypothetical protein